jgi:SAM-dependent methyltransferase
LKAECREYIPTQSFPLVPRGEVHNGFRCEDLEALTFKDNSIDIHVSQDVFEHVLNPGKAFQEIARTLRPGGMHIFTVPILNGDQPTEVCVRPGENGTLEYLRPPEYHGNPISEAGSLVTRRWGYDICDFIFDCSGLFTAVVIVDALDLGIRAEYIDVLMTKRPAE